MNIVIISGSPATGKTTLAKKIANTLGYPLYSKDGLKQDLLRGIHEKPFFYFHHENKAKQALLDAICNSVSGGKSCVAETTFTHKDKNKLLLCLNENVKVVEIHCFAKGFTRLKRFIERNESREKHLRRKERKWYITMFIGALLAQLGVEWPHPPLCLSEKFLRVDTTDFTKVDYEKVLNFVQQHNYNA